MSYSSVEFWLCLLVFLVVYYWFTPKKFRYVTLLLCSYFVYACWDWRYPFFLLFSTLSTWCGALWLEKRRMHSPSKRKFVAGYIVLVLINVLLLVITKYTGFVLNNISTISEEQTNQILTYILVPVGISYYIFQTTGYLIDIKRGEAAERNILKYALYVSYFPKMVAGPIEKYKIFAEKIDALAKYKLQDVQQNVLYILWGWFLKIVIADRCAIYVNQVYKNFALYGAIELGVVFVLYSIQIYSDFQGYMYMTRGVSGFFGVDLVKNFRQPYFATSIKDFWRRWHISLTDWLTTYVYISLGGSRKGKIRQYINIMIVFLVSGIWHGANWNFIVWGGLHGIYQVVGNVKKLVFHKKDEESYKLSTKVRKMLTTFLMVSFAWIFFGADSLQHAWELISTFFTRLYHMDFIKQSLLNVGSGRLGDWYILIIAIGILVLVEISHEKKVCITKKISREEIWFQALVTSGLFIGVILFGVYGTGYNVSDFIYSRF